MVLKIIDVVFLEFLYNVIRQEKQGKTAKNLFAMYDQIGDKTSNANTKSVPNLTITCGN